MSKNVIYGFLPKILSKKLCVFANIQKVIFLVVKITKKTKKIYIFSELPGITLKLSKNKKVVCVCGGPSSHCALRMQCLTKVGGRGHLLFSFGKSV